MIAGWGKMDSLSSENSSAKPKPYTTLRAKMTTESRARSEEQTRILLQEMQALNSVDKGR